MKEAAPLFERVHFLHELDLQDLLGNGCVSVASSEYRFARLAQPGLITGSLGSSPERRAVAKPADWRFNELV